MFNSFYNNYIYPLLLRTFFIGCRIHNVIKEKWQEVLHSSEIVRYITSEVDFITKRSYAFMIGQRMESRDLPWINIYGVTPNMKSLTQIYSLVENTNPFFNDYFFADLFLSDDDTTYAKKYVSMIGQRIPRDQISPLIIIKGYLNKKEDPIYIVRRGPFNIENPIKICSSEKSKARLMLVEYIHPHMDESIELKMDDNWFIVGNELFTPSFVLRTLEYQPKYFLFDKGYKIRIMDTECNIREITADEYILVDKDTMITKHDEVFSEDEGMYDADSDTDSVSGTK